MKLSSIEIENYRCFENLTVKLEDDVTVFVGINGSGKSAVLDAIAVALWQIVQANLVWANGQRTYQYRVKQRATLSDSDVRIPSEFDTNARRAPRVGPLDAMQLTVEYAGYRPLRLPGIVEGPIRWTGRQSYRGRNGSRRPKLTTSSEIGDGLRLYFENLWEEIRQEPGANIPLPAVAYYRATRRVSGMPPLGDLFRDVYQRESSYADALDAGTSYAETCLWLYVAENAALRDQSDRGQWGARVVQTISEVIGTAIGNVSKVGFDGTPPELIATLNGTSGGHQLALEQLSDGYRNMIALIIDFARRLAVANPNSPEPLKEPGIMLIDEIELHLHPGWQQTIIPRLRAAFPNTQLIATTHSPQVISTLHRNQVRLLSEDHTIIPLPDDVGTYGVESSQALERVLGVHSRPRQGVTSVKVLDDYLRMIEEGHGTSERAVELRESLERDMGRSEPALIRADMRIRQLKILGAKQ
jgi:predicted ATP-binding protein involved in virulence